jgi:hypothetical protein
MVTVFGSRFAPFKQKGIVSQTSIARDNMQGTLEFKFGADVMEQVEKTGVNGLHLSGKTIAHDVVYFGKGLRNIFSIRPIRRTQRLFRIWIE